jgi:hypothetical protein
VRTHTKRSIGRVHEQRQYCLLLSASLSFIIIKST